MDRFRSTLNLCSGENDRRKFDVFSNTGKRARGRGDGWIQKDSQTLFRIEGEEINGWIQKHSQAMFRRDGKDVY